jgi:threonine dehydratase
VTLEIVEQLGQKLDYLMVPVGGGGLAAGASLVLNALSKDTNFIGFEPIGHLPCLKACWRINQFLFKPLINLMMVLWSSKWANEILIYAKMVFLRC